MVGAVVGVQPFGGEGLSGTGPKAGGPLYALRLLSRRPASALADALDSAGMAVSVDTRGRETLKHELLALQAWASQNGRLALAQACASFAQATPSGANCTLPGPTGELNTYSLVPKEQVLCLADDGEDLLVQLAAIVAVGSRALVSSKHAGLPAGLPRFLLDRVRAVEDWPGQQFDAVLFHGPRSAATELARALAEQEGPIIALTALDTGCTDVPLERLVTERSVSINTAAAGGNTALMTLN